MRQNSSIKVTMTRICPPPVPPVDGDVSVLPCCEVMMMIIVVMMKIQAMPGKQSTTVFQLQFSCHVWLPLCRRRDALLMRLGNFSFDLRNCSWPDCISYVHQSQQCALRAGCVHCVSATVYLCLSILVSEYPHP